VTDLRDVSIEVKNYKSIGADEQGYEGIRPVNLIIGRNNTGKSTLLDLIEYATSPVDRNLSEHGHRRLQPEVTITNYLREDELRPLFQENTGGGSIPGNHWTFGSRWIGKPITWRLEPGGNHAFVALDPPLGIHNPESWNQNLARQNDNPFQHYAFKKLLADRDISPEADSTIGMAGNGDGATNTIQHFLNKAGLPTELVKETLLSKLNEIFEPDATFTEIDVQQLGDGRWEVYLAEAEKGPIPLSQSGSGIKTILLVLVCLYLIPRVEGRPLSQYLFGFEELENNLHPALQRRLLLFLRQVAVQEGCKFFLTTHSNVAIDLFANDTESQIIHVTHNRQQATVRNVTTYVDNRGILDDLDVRASDLLQANGIVWVEGPSDRLYFNRWMELVSEGEIREGAHYQCVFYGGKLLAHLSGVEPNVDADEAVKIFEVNRNALVILDSDRRKFGHELNETKRRIISEVQDVGDMVWVTAGREVENYIPVSALESLYSVDSLPPLEPFADIAAYLDKIEDGEGAKYLRNKVLFAGKIIPHITRDGLTVVLDLEYKMVEAHQRILEWNRASRSEGASVLTGA
jgi:hypothetical protein